MNSLITGTGIGIPKNVVTNHDLARVMDTSDEWIRTRTGIEQRHIVEKGTPTSTLAATAPWSRSPSSSRCSKAAW